MPTVVLTKGGETLRGEVPEKTNLVVKAGIKQFPHPLMRYGCGMGRCAKCACRVVAGAADLPEANWKENRTLGTDRLAEGYRLMCQLWITHDIELVQDVDPIAPAKAPAETNG